jgi:hypothetical protein
MQVSGQLHASRAFMATEIGLVPTRERDPKAGLDVAAEENTCSSQKLNPSHPMKN